MVEISHPAPGEFADFYANYIAKVPASGPLSALEKNRDELTDILEKLTVEQANYSYAPGKWTVKELLGHLNDSERIFTYRCLRIARGDETPLAGFDENLYVESGAFQKRSLESMLSEYKSIRNATLSLFSSLDEAALQRMGTANGYPVSVRALVWIAAGHETHHLGVLKERYLPGIS